MKEFNLKWFGKINDIKSFRVKTHNILLIEFAKCDLQKTIELFKKDVSKFGIFITICSCGPNKTIYTTDSNNVWLEVAKHTNKNIDCPSKQTINSNLDRVIVVVSSNPKDKFTKKELWWLKTELTREFSSSGKFSVSSSLHNSKQKITNSEIFFLKQELEIIKTGLYFLNGNYFPNFINTTNDYLQSKNKDKEYLENDSIKVFPKIGKTTKVIVSSGKFIFNKRTHKIKACIGTTFQGQVISTFNNLKRFSLMLKKFKKNFFGDFDQRKGTFNLKVIKEIEASPSTIGFFIAARNVNGWICWQDENDKLIDSYR